MDVWLVFGAGVCLYALAGSAGFLAVSTAAKILSWFVSNVKIRNPQFQQDAVEMIISSQISKICFKLDEDDSFWQKILKFLEIIFQVKYV